MTAGRGWGTRTVRAAVFAAVCVVLAALGHVMMSGSPVPWWTMAAGGVMTGGAGWCLAGGERQLPLIVTVVAVAQGLLHAGFPLARPAAPSVGSGSGGGASMPMATAGRDMGAPRRARTAVPLSLGPARRADDGGPASTVARAGRDLA
ncbi:hypothetical protein [Streptomyces sp. NPDC020747]|uniref:hypothetical protein n=1 Tax=Streptomyces sp. NPDC020747 TaxID=3365086 RepID=UPI0037BABE2E